MKCQMKYNVVCCIGLDLGTVDCFGLGWLEAVVDGFSCRLVFWWFGPVVDSFCAIGLSWFEPIMNGFRAIGLG